MDWYEQDKENIRRWYKTGNNDSFEERFIKRFTMGIRKEKWMQELLEVKQKKGETVNLYEIRFKGLIRKVKNDITEIHRITLFM